MKSASELVELYHKNTINFPSQMHYAPGESYTTTPSKRYAPHPYDAAPPINQGMPDFSQVKSTRLFSDRAIELDELFALLHSSYRLQLTPSGYDALTPSAGGLYPIELYVFVRNVQGVHPGIYAYQRVDGHLNYLREWNLDFLPKVNQFIEHAAVLVLMTANLTQVTRKYGARGYRYALLESGHIGQMLALTAERLGLGGCALGGMFDRTVEDLLQLPSHEVPVYGYCFGKIKVSGDQK